MEAPDLLPLLEQLDDNMDDLEEVLEPILGHSLSKASKKLPVMDKAKLHVLVTYTLESLIFSYLRLHGVDAKQHPVFRELTRVKQYFEKIKALETEPEQRTMTLDKEAAGRFIKHGLAGNDKYDLERAEKEAKERARAHLKATLLARKSAATPADSPAGTEDAPSTGQSDASEDSDDEGNKQVDFPQPTEFDLERKRKMTEETEEKAKARSKEAKKQRKLSKADRKESKKERRQKKEEVRKARKAK
ncbi:hypothetical protein N7510_000890 [Penicillium lagena]|uniref:uncharacterized protein n=1 Tax=Penicillium lagena TaxID=94218 RepID=UPI002541D10C|nr:uncharacterized protein N7510_000890 [Penicillium lagena]KAJ5624581.1 hypothetical protein N7510_000890 [Penicillium lagena]